MAGLWLCHKENAVEENIDDASFERLVPLLFCGDEACACDRNRGI